MPGPPEDSFSNTVADAAAYEDWRARNDPSSYFEAEADYDAYDAAADEAYEKYHENEEDYDRCGCSDPSCPCDGVKRGLP